MKPLAAATLVAAVFATAAAAPAQPFDRLIVFGDSLSDVGNVQQKTAAIPLVPATPGPFYFDGRFSNGPVYAEVVADGLGLGPLTRSTAGGTNYAHGGALATGTSFFRSLVVDDVDDQVDDFLDDATPDADDLFIVYAGGNDVAMVIDEGGDAADAAEELAAQVARLYDAGGRRFLTPNLPSLDLTPRFAGRGRAATLTDAFNAALDAALDDVEATRPGLVTFRLDVAGLFDAIRAEPLSFGFTNVADPAAPGLSPGDGSYDTSRIAADPDTYAFWDDFHPTAATHEVLGGAALAIIPEPGALVLIAAPGMCLLCRRGRSRRLLRREADLNGNFGRRRIS